MPINELYLKQFLKGTRERTSLIIFIFGFLIVILFAFNLFLSNLSSQNSQGKISEQAAHSQIESELESQIGIIEQSKIYTINPGDSLWTIAADNYSDPMVWNDIYKLNKEVIGPNPDLILPFTEISLPNIMHR